MAAIARSRIGRTANPVFRRTRGWPVTARMVFLSVGLCLATIVILTMTGYRFAKGGLNANLENALTWETNLATITFDSDRQSLLKWSSDTAAYQPIQQMLEMRTSPTRSDQTTIRQLLSNISASRPYVVYLAVLRPDGSVFVDSSDNPSASEIPSNDAFRQALNGHSGTSGVVISADIGKPSMYYDSPIRDTSGHIIGVFCINVSMQRINYVIDDAKHIDYIIHDSNHRINLLANSYKGPVAKNTFAMVLDQDGIVMASSLNPTWVQHPIGTLPPDRVSTLVADRMWGDAQPPASLHFASLAQRLADKQPHAFNWTVNGKPYRAVMDVVGTSGWTYVVALPLAAYNASATSFLHEAEISGAAVLTIATLLAVGLVRLLIRERRQFAAREQELVQEVAILRIEIDQATREADVRQIVESDYFQDLASRAKAQRNRAARTPLAQPDATPADL